ncbi:hypothetical protein EOD40_10605 [Flavobacterium sufflavum]|uniref:SGNH/GDSL hydrolase family protein n=1 Tax=Flavobacterium sufflavum TaxID=1921138 RepID=A0A3S3SVP9_9FLAO|nr:hypothetical protein [Flavobacterium sufflavum]RVT75897.1 hypothetical protein EOD40_10605 [Flavobacterium sufflavum]
MKQFLGFTIKTIIIIVVLAIILDYCYTSVYLQSNNRNKIEYVYNSKSRNYDVVILGSSRANNHFVTEMFEQKGLKTFNYGMSGGHLFEADLMLKLMLERNYKIKTVILEADLNLSNDKRSETVAAKFLPYIHDSEIIKKHFLNEADFNYLYYLPFYRYVNFDGLIGFREFYKTLSRQPTNVLDKGGYHALGNKKGNMKNNIRALKPLKNKYYEEIKSICVANKINFIAVMTPMCENTKGIDYFDKVKKAYPEIHNYENVVVEDKFFSSCGHMNNAGARIFTARIINDFFTE